MRSSKLIWTLLVLFILTACNSESIPDHQKQIVDSEVEAQEIKEEPKEFTQFDDRHKEVEALINQRSEESLAKALRILNAELFAPQAQDPVVYTSSSYIGFVNIYVKAFKVWETQDKSTEFYKNFEMSLTQFKAKFIDSCNKTTNDCELIKTSLRQEKSVLTIVLYFSELETDNKAKLNLLGIAYDLSGRRKEQKLEEMYVQALMQMIENPAGAGETLQAYQQHSRNLIYLLDIKDWTQKTERQKALFKAIKPWKYRPPQKDVVDYLRVDLINLIPVYTKNDSSILEEVKQEVAGRIEEITKNKFDLSQYPAFNQVNIDGLKSEDPIVVLLLLNIYFLNQSDANQYLAQLENKADVIEKIYKLSKELVRWDVAQLSIDSTKKLAKKFMEQEVKSKDFVQNNIDYGKTLVPGWTEFHAVRLANLKKFLNGNRQYYTKVSEKEIVDFFDSINRNILKTTVYPNMLAYMYHMAKTEWKATLYIFIWVVSLDTTDIFDYMMTGNYYYPWFNFVNLTEDPGYNDDTRSSLFRSEILDSVYYLFTTNTHKEYAVNADDFIKTVGEVVMKKRLPKFESVMTVQSQNYYKEDATLNQFVSWCKGIEGNGKKEREIIPFYDLDSRITPFTGPLSTATISISSLEAYYLDNYNSDVLPTNVNSSEMNDRFRNEYLPIMHTYSQLLSIVDRLKISYPGLIDESLSESKEYGNYLDRMRKAYIGSQIGIHENIGTCITSTVQESRRRGRALGFAEYTYMKDIVYPLIQKVKSGEVALDDANQMIKDIHKNHPGFLDEIRVLGDNYTYKLSLLGYMLRVRQIVTEGLTVDNEVIGKVKIDPVVGSHLSIPIPTNLLDDKTSPYFNTNGSLRPYRDVKLENLSAEEFAKSSVRITTDELAGAFFTPKYTQWDKYDAGRYQELLQKRIEFFTQLYLMSGEEYFDFSNPECRDYINEVPKECVKTNNMNLDLVAEELARVFKLTELDEESVEYMELIAQKGYVSSQNMDLQLKIDPNGVYDFSTNSLPYSETAGFFDLIALQLQSEYLGFLFKSEYEVFLASRSTDDRGGSINCPSMRDNCYWGSDRIRAVDFFQSRAKRKGLIFNFDKQILVDNYNYVKADVMNRFDKLLEVQNQSETLLEKYRQGESDMYLYDLSKEPKPLEALSPGKKNNHIDKEKFLKEETEGYYLSEPNWDKYIDAN